MDLQILGATGTVTGSKYPVSRNEHRLRVDCGRIPDYGRPRLRITLWHQPEPFAMSAPKIRRLGNTASHPGIVAVELET
jgi:hypothetical protein